MISRKTCGWAVATTVLGCTMGLAIAAYAINREDQTSNQTGNQTRQQQNFLERNRQQYDQYQRANDPTTTTRRANDRTDTTRRNGAMDKNAVKLEGKGQQTTKAFPLERGLAIIEAEHEGDSNFIVRLLDVNGREIGTLINQVGPFEGEIGFAVDRTGDCMLDVQASDDWNVRMSQPRPQQANSAPTKFEGKGYKTTPMVRLDRGVTTFKTNHKGQGTFKAQLMDKDGRPVGPVASSRGRHNGTKPMVIPADGLYFLNISADGDWVVDIQ